MRKQKNVWKRIWKDKLRYGFIKRKVKGEGYAAASKNLLPSIMQNLV